MMQAMGLKSPAPIQSRLKHLQDKGYISWQEGKARTLQLVDEIFDGVPSSKISKEKLLKWIEVENLLATETNFLKSVSEARRALKENSISINKKRISQNIKITKNDLINGKYTLLQRGRKNYYLLIVN